MPEYKFKGVVTEVSEYAFYIEADSPEEAEDIINAREFDWDGETKHQEYYKSEIDNLQLLTIDGKEPPSYTKLLKEYLDNRPCQNKNSTSAT